MTDEQVQALNDVMASSLAKGYLLNNMIAVLREDGIISQAQIHRANEAAKKQLEKLGALGLHASLFLESPEGREI